MGEVGCLKDGNFQNLQGENTILNSLVYKRPVVNIDAATYTPSVSQSGTLFILNSGNSTNTIVVALPVASAGLIYEFYVANDMSGFLAITGNTSDDRLRGLIKMSTAEFKDSGDATTSERGHCGPVASHHSFAANADTKGRKAGTYLVFKCISDNDGSSGGRWSIYGHAITAGNIATPFA